MDPFGPDRFYVRRVSAGGDPSEDVALRDTPWSGRYQLSIAVDQARRGVLSWDPVEHSLARVSLDDGTVIATEVARAMLPEPRSSDQGGYFGAEPGLVLSPDGQRVYAVGVALGPSDSGTPTGVWAFDAETLEPHRPLAAARHVELIGRVGRRTIRVCRGSQRLRRRGQPGPQLAKFGDGV